MKTGLFRAIVADPAGSVRDPCVHYDGRTILFSYRPAGEEHFHLYTVNADGLELKRLTSGGYDDIEPAWLPDGDIVFVSTRCRRWVNCWVTQVATIYRMKADGFGIRIDSPGRVRASGFSPTARICQARRESSTLRTCRKAAA